jgi:hypothetical protein
MTRDNGKLMGDERVFLQYRRAFKELARLSFLSQGYRRFVLRLMCYWLAKHYQGGRPYINEPDGTPRRK